MHIHLLKTYLLVIISALIAGNAIADDTYTCRYGESVREIQVKYEQPGQAVPCSVIYRKDGSEQVLWSAQAEEGYCESKADAFAAKQRGWGWECAKESEKESDTANETAAVE